MMTVLELIEKLEEAASENTELNIAAAFEGMSDDECVTVASIDLESVLLCPGNDTIILHFVPIPIIKESLEIAESIQEVLDNEEAEVLGEIDLEDPDKEGLSY